MAHSHSCNTLFRTICGEADSEQLSWGPGEPLLVLSPTCAPGEDRARRRISLFAGYHTTDIHLTDTGTGRSLEVLRPLDIGDGELGTTYRAWAPFGPSILASVVRTMNTERFSPISGRAVDMLVVGGDFMNNSQLNELHSFYSTLTGHQGRPFKRTFTLHGSRFSYEPRAAERRNIAQWFRDHSHMSLYKAAATRIMGTEPLRYPTAFLLGNHDVTALGRFAHSLPMSLWAMQPFKVMSVKPLDVPEIMALSRTIEDTSASPEEKSQARRKIVREVWRLRSNFTLAYSAVDFSRRAATPEKIWKLMSGLLSGLPVERGGAAHYALRPRKGVKLLMLDTTSIAGGPEGHLTEEQFQWLSRKLSEAEENRELVIVFSHHPSFRLVEPRKDPWSDKPVRLAADLVRLLLQHKCVVAHVGGHTHQNRVIFHRDRQNPGRGYWEIVTCSLTDWPQQFRFLELFRNGDGTLSLITSMMNHMAPADPGTIDLPRHAEALPIETVLQLASFARKLSYHDFLLGHDTVAGQSAAGRDRDRNLELTLQDPYAA